jgi:hypothetical protein
MRPRTGVGADTRLVGLVGVPVDVSGVVVGDEDLPLALGQHAAADLQLAVLVDVTFEAGLAVDVGAGVDRMGQDLVHGGVGRFHPDDLTGGVVDAALERHLQALLFEPQPHPAGRAAGRELFEDRRDDTADSLVGVAQDLPVGVAPHEPDRQPTTQLATGGLVTDPTVEAGAQDVQFGLGHRAFHPQQQPVVEQRRVVDAVGVGDQRVGHAGQVQQPVPVCVVARKPGHLQRQHDTDLAQPDLGGQLSEPGPAGGRRARDTLVVVDDPDASARPAQPGRAGNQVILAGGGLPVAVHLSEGGLAYVDHGSATQMRPGDLAGLTHRPPPASMPPWRPWRSMPPAARRPPRPALPGAGLSAWLVAPEPAPASD